MAEDQLSLTQIAATGDALYGLTKDGSVWWFDKNASIWKRQVMKFEMTVGGPLGGRLG